ncbi:L-serine dehydratase, iron-sulfur-dependent, beta subunit [Bacillus cytotoxicus NVH 391-98]|uniref:L-serine deaminase n=2 Tax=Bacillus cytotoxicus TaxID=580165 RepID=A7GSG0_BACCN|nr:L-serine dehydratase, iron-sulfur-dependent, beta subunit [Bacillus cytotoxicus NVH 391-98]
MMKYRSVFDIIGPVMIGPSSSHTAGAARMGQVARQLFRQEPERIIISLYGSFAKTYRGHGTDVALIGGILGFETDDVRIPNSLEIAKERGIEIDFIEEEANAPHPNTARIRLYKGEEEIEVVACSIGGGKIEVVELNGFDLQLSGTSPALLIVNNDRFGAIASVASILAKHEINISTMSVSRKEKGRKALMVIETDEALENEVIEEIKEQSNICQVTIMD